MEINESVIQMYGELINNISTEENNESSTITSVEQSRNINAGHDQYGSDNLDDNDIIEGDGVVEVTDGNEGNDLDETNEANDDEEERHDIMEIVNTHIHEQSNLLNINQINTDINFPWKLQAVVSLKHQKRIYNNDNGIGEISTWDLVDETGSINLVAFNLNSNLMSNKLVEGKAYEFGGLTIRTVDDHYKTLSHNFQLIVNNQTSVREIVMEFKYHIIYNFVHLDQIERLPLNSIIDVDVNVLRDYGLAVGNTDLNSWARRELHVAQDGVQIRLTLWNELAKKITTTVINKRLKVKNVKIHWFNGSRTLVSLNNTRLSIS